MVFGCRLSKSINCAIGFIMLAGALIDDSFAKESLCNQFAIDHRARHIKVACESFEESLSPTPFPGAGKVLNCDDYRAETHDKCVAFQNAVEGYLALPDVVAERKLYLDGVKVYEAYMGSHEHKVKIEEFYYYHKRFPKSNAEAGVGREKYSEYADSIEIRKKGVVIISLSPELSRNGKLILNPKRTSNEK